MHQKSAVISSYLEPSGVRTNHRTENRELTPEQEAVVISHLPTVRAIARRVHERLPQHVTLDDLYSAGTLGLLDAVKRFDPQKQVLFRSYAQFRIRGAILDSLRSLDWSPRRLRRKGREVAQIINDVGTRLGRTPTESEIAVALNTTLTAYHQLLTQLNSLERGSFHDQHSAPSGGEWIDLLPARPQDDPLFRYLRAEMRGTVTDAISKLPERERLVMTLYYYEELQMKEIGIILGVMEHRVSQIHASALAHLRYGLLGPENRKAKSACGKQPDQCGSGRP